MIYKVYKIKLKNVPKSKFGVIHNDASPDRVRLGDLDISYLRTKEAKELYPLANELFMKSVL